MATAKRFEDLDVWQRAKEPANLIHRYSAGGFESQTRPLFLQIHGRTKGPAGERCIQIYIAHEQGYPSEDEFKNIPYTSEVCSKQSAKFFDTLKLNPMLLVYGKME